MLSDWPYEFPGAYWFDAQEEQALAEVMRQRAPFRYYGLGKPQFVDAYEAAAREFYGVPHALAINSGTGALMAAMSALGIGPGCEVIVPAFLWVATVAAVVQQNAIPVLCEVDDSLTLDPVDLERKITPRTKLIVPIHMAGAPCNLEAIQAIAQRHGIAVLEDCAQCNGGTFRGQPVGTFGQIGIFSLQLNKNMTCGEGGLLITRDPQLFERAFSVHDMGMVRVNGRLATPEPHAIGWGAGRRMSELAGALAAVQIQKLPKIVAAMRGSKQRIKAMLEGTPGLTFRRQHGAAGDTGVFLIFFLPSEAHAAEAVQRMKAGGLHNTFHVRNYGLHIYSNIPALVGRVPLSPAGNPWNLPQNAQSKYNYDQGSCPQSDAWFGRAVLLPIPSCLTPAQEEAAAQVVRQAVA